MEIFQLTGEPKWLSNSQLLEIILGQLHSYHQSFECSSDLSEAIIRYLELRSRELPHEQLERELLTLGLDYNQIGLLKANQEFFRRVLYPLRQVISKPSELHTLMMYHGSRPEENLHMITLNAAQELLGQHFISRGSLTRTEMNPREIFKVALKDNAATIILMHNHPSGNVQPSESDIASTRRLWLAGELMGIPLADHIIFTQKEYYSFREHNKMPTVAPK